MAKLSRAQQEKVRRVMREFKEGKLRSSSGKKVTSRKQAIAIALSQARRMHRAQEGATVVSAYDLLADALSETYRPEGS